ncbi:muscarinic acetylcholine receptor M3-like [Scleropages formosus]|uniref:Muscarinic acetylcholine receptor n=1 Tax=Scleropages formosus TaxID=113540 RepID=A0A0P7XFB6_SCLFO|nr:muscarinic acetylcholine receptor M1-like [Scleropages formosus]KPP74906.1 muscarinic acetylcholine receptor M3-like [Scleropages formosus]
MNISCASQASNFTNTLGGHQIWEVALIILITGPLSLATIVGNLLVVISIRVNRNLHTVNNYFLLSLAVADLILGTISMNLYTTYIIMGRWPLGNLACDIWLAIDYVTSNASVMNLLVISFDRFFSVTRPLTYRVKRTPRRAGIMIGLAWAVSFVLWAPAILFWEYIEGRRKVQDGECFIQFFSQPIITFATAIAAFYLPVTIMIFLYWRVYRETKNRTRDLSGLLASVVAHGPSQPPRWQPTYSNSTKSSISSSREMQTRENCGREGQSGCFSIRQKTPRLTHGRSVTALSSHSEESSIRVVSHSCWELEEEASNSTSSEEEHEQDAKGVSALVVRVPLIQMSDVQEHIKENITDSGIRRMHRLGARQLGSLPSFSTGKQPGPNSPKPPITNKRRSMIVKEKKAARTLTAILLAFIITWTPYNIMVLLSIFYCVPEKLWQLGYWLCYVNSTVNPVCYALCNESFRITFKRLLLCRWDRRKWAKPQQSVRLSLKSFGTSSTV